ncbi:MAG: GTPase family protein, partial [Planctomycetia bacterium]
RTLSKAPKWFQLASNLYTVLRAPFDPVGVSARYFASKMGVDPAMKLIQENALLWFYSLFVQRMGASLIELNSRRLRVGAKRWRELTSAQFPDPKAVDGPSASAESDSAPKTEAIPQPSTEQSGAALVVPRTDDVVLAIVGQVKAGKSSLVNALLGRRSATADVLPQVDGAKRYELSSPKLDARLVLFDTAGYAHAEAGRALRRETREAMTQADLVLVVLDAMNPARSADAAFLAEAAKWFDDHPERKRPRLLAVVTHLDALPPPLEWNPPYDWRNRNSPFPKEQNILDLVDYTREILGDRVEQVIPVKLAAPPAPSWNVDEELLPAVAALLGEARGAALVRALNDEADEGKTTRVLQQLWNTGRRLLEAAATDGRPV